MLAMAGSNGNHITTPSTCLYYLFGKRKKMILWWLC